ncbi:MAG: hypothetical protein ABI743_01020 [bacterium]
MSWPISIPGWAWAFGTPEQRAAGGILPFIVWDPVLPYSTPADPDLPDWWRYVTNPATPPPDTVPNPGLFPGWQRNMGLGSDIPNFPDTRGANVVLIAMSGACNYQDAPGREGHGEDTTQWPFGGTDTPTDPDANFWVPARDQLEFYLTNYLDVSRELTDNPTYYICMFCERDILAYLTADPGDLDEVVARLRNYMELSIDHTKPWYGRCLGWHGVNEPDLYVRVDPDDPDDPFDSVGPMKREHFPPRAGLGAPRTLEDFYYKVREIEQSLRWDDNQSYGGTLWQNMDSLSGEWDARTLPMMVSLSGDGYRSPHANVDVQDWMYAPMSYTYTADILFFDGFPYTRTWADMQTQEPGYKDCTTRGLPDGNPDWLNEFVVTNPLYSLDIFWAFKRTWLFGTNSGRPGCHVVNWLQGGGFPWDDNLGDPQEEPDEPEDRTATSATSPSRIEGPDNCGVDPTRLRCQIFPELWKQRFFAFKSFVLRSQGLGIFSQPGFPDDRFADTFTPLINEIRYFEKVFRPGAISVDMEGKPIVLIPTSKLNPPEEIPAYREELGVHVICKSPQIAWFQFTMPPVAADADPYPSDTRWWLIMFNNDTKRHVIDMVLPDPATAFTYVQEVSHKTLVPGGRLLLGTVPGGDPTLSITLEGFEMKLFFYPAFSA